MYRGYRFPAEIILYAVWLNYRFNFSHCDVDWKGQQLRRED